MITSSGNTFGYEGLNDMQVLDSRKNLGVNRVVRKDSGLLKTLFGFLREPMLLLLIAACGLYFITGQSGDAFFMLLAIAFTVSISLYQNYRSRKALQELQTLTQPECRVIRNSKIVQIPIAEIVVDDLLLAEEGSTVSADGIIIHANDFSVNESILTGESLSIGKTSSVENNKIYQGTTVTRGLAICRVTAVGTQTELGRIGKSLEDIKETETPLQIQIRSFVGKMAMIGIVFFLAVWGINFMRTSEILNSLLKSLALAMSILPEEIPVAFTTFMAIGAWRLSKQGVIVKRTSTIETLGSANVICIDKTGTITKNKMELTSVYAFKSDKVSMPGEDKIGRNEVIRTAMWASEPIPFDPMEISLHQAYAQAAQPDERNNFRMIHEYPLGGSPPFMTHVFEDKAGTRIIAAKGAPEAIIGICQLTEAEESRIREITAELSSGGARILGVASGKFNQSVFPEDQHMIPFTFIGLVAFYDPPKENVQAVIQSFYEAGIEVKIITGDHPGTALAIARQINFRTSDHVLTGKELMEMEEDEVLRTVEDTTVFARMFPQAKLKILNALKKNGHIVAMTGDGVNDAPALKAAHISIAMGKRGTEIAKEVSSLILSDDDLEKMVNAVAAGRKIYSNLKKAIQYIISIHIPIILTVFVPLILGWIYPNLFTPVHVIFMELVMGPTCSIIYENEPMENILMHQKPRSITRTFFNGKELGMSILQGLVISIGVLSVYQVSVGQDYSETLTRSMVFVTLISANIFLTLINRSNIKPVWVSILYKNPLIPLILFITLTMMIVIIFVPPVSIFFQVQSLSAKQILLCIGVGFLSVIWIEPVKLFISRMPIAINSTKNHVSA